MKNLFTFSKRKDASKHLRTIARIIKIFFLILACIFALCFLIYGLSNSDFGSEFVIFAIFLGAVCFFVLLLIGWIIEVLFLGFSNVVENQYDELVLKNKGEELEKNNKEDRDVYTRLQQLFDMKNAGIITEEEYEQKKKEALKGL